MASIGEITYQVGTTLYTKDEIVAKYSQIQSAHDKSKSRDFTEEEMAIKGFYKSIQSARDSARIKASKSASIVEEVRPAPVCDVVRYQFGENEYSTDDIIRHHSKIQSAHDKNKSLEFTAEDLQIEKWYKQIQSARDSERIARSKMNRERAHTTTPIAEIPTRLIGEKQFTDAMICAEYSQIQSLHDRDKQLGFSEYEREIQRHYREIQSQRDSERIRAQRKQSYASDSVRNLYDDAQSLLVELNSIQNEKLVRLLNDVKRLQLNCHMTMQAESHN